MVFRVSNCDELTREKFSVKFSVQIAVKSVHETSDKCEPET